MAKSSWKKLGDRDLFAKNLCCWWDNHGGGAKFKKEQRQKARRISKKMLQQEINEEFAGIVQWKGHPATNRD